VSLTGAGHLVAGQRLCFFAELAASIALVLIVSIGIVGEVPVTDRGDGLKEPREIIGPLIAQKLKLPCQAQ